jgi:hypothetical protein
MSLPNKGGRSLTYATDLKIAVARDYLTSSLGYGKLAMKYNLPNADTVRYMVKWYRSVHPDLITVSTPGGVVPPVPASAVDKQLKEANLKIMALELLIANASKELGVDIVKKPGTKQSSR